MKKIIIAIASLGMQSLSLIFAQPMLYGPTRNGGPLQRGTLFSFDAATGIGVRLNTFNGVNGLYPMDGLVQGSNGKFYGLTELGGGIMAGCLFSLDPVTGEIIRVHSFSDDSWFPKGGLVAASDGKLYGTTTQPYWFEERSCKLFSFDPRTNLFTVEAVFPNELVPNPGYLSRLEPNGSLMEASDGKLYGTTRFGGSLNKGTLFVFDPVDKTLRSLKFFSQFDGAEPNDGLIQASDGNLYGMTTFGGSSDKGVIYSFDPRTETFEKLHDFQGVTGAEPRDKLTQYGNGMLYGLTTLGTLISYDIKNRNTNKVSDLSDGPQGRLTYASDGYLYGMVAEGPGHIIRFDPVSNLVTTVFVTQDDNGFGPENSLAEFMNTWTGAISDAWNNPGNWIPAGIPPPNASIIIPGNLNNYPNLDQDRSVTHIRWEQGGRISLNGQTLTVGGTLTGQGGFKGSNTSGLVITGQAGVVRFTEDRSLRNLTLQAKAQAILGSTLEVIETLTLNDAFLDLEHNGLVLRSTSGGTARIADLTGSALSNVDNVTVERYIPNTGRRWRLLTAPLDNLTINAAWQNSQTWNGISPFPGDNTATLITGQQQGNAANANGRGFDFWSAIGNSAASVLSYTQRAGQGVWSPLPNTTASGAFNNDQAYLLFVRGPRSSSYATGTTNAATTLRPSGTLKQGDRNIPVDGTKGYTLIGNPYPSQIDFNSIYTSNGNGSVIKRQLWVWDATSGNAGNFIAVVYSGGKYVEVPAKFHAPGQASPLTTIQSGQGFFVLPLTTSGGTLRIRENNKTAALPAQPNILLSNDNTPRVYLNLLKIGLDGQTITADGIMAAYGNDYRMQATDEADVRKFENLAENLAIRNGDSSFIAEARPLSGWNEPIALRLWNLSADSYRFEARIDGMPDDGRRAFLEDRQWHTRTPLAMNGEITSVDFSIAADEASRAEDRFRIVFGKEALNASPAPDNTGDERALSVYPNPLTGRSFNVRLQQMPAGTYTLQLFSSEGRVVMSRQVTHDGRQRLYSMEISGALPKGGYRLRCLRGDEVVSQESLLIQ